MHTFLSVTMVIDDFVGHSIFEKHASDRNIDQTTRGQTLWRSIQLETDITITSFPLGGAWEQG